MKSRFRILRSPVTFHTKEDLQNIMFCCCILHNVVLSADGIDTAWGDDVSWDTLEPDADLDGEEIIILIPPVVVDIVPGLLNNAILLVQDTPMICQVSSICMRNHSRKKQI